MTLWKRSYWKLWLCMYILGHLWHHWDTILTLYISYWIQDKVLLQKGTFLTTTSTIIKHSSKADMSSACIQNPHFASKHGNLWNFLCLCPFLLEVVIETSAKGMPYFINIHGRPFSTAGDDWSHNCLITKTNFNKFSFWYNTYYLYITQIYYLSVPKWQVYLLCNEFTYTDSILLDCANSQILYSFMWFYMYTRHTRY